MSNIQRSDLTEADMRQLVEFFKILGEWDQEAKREDRENAVPLEQEGSPSGGFAADESRNGRPRRRLDHRPRPMAKKKRPEDENGLLAKPYLRFVSLIRESVPSFDKYPFSIPAVAGLEALEFHPQVTFLVGENGSGKSTLIEANAVLAGTPPSSALE